MSTATALSADVRAASGPRWLGLVERRHVDLMRVSGCQCCGRPRMR